jgi:dTDP-4-amino-4,6-dideoxygalactose transaminase
VRVRLVDLNREYQAIGREAEAAIQGVLKRGDFILGQAVQRFEQEFAKFCNARFAVGTSCGLDGLHLALLANGVGPGDEVITAANTFIATAFAISTVGARPVLVDVDEATFNINPSQMESRITPATKALIPVHLYGQPADMEPLLEMAEGYGLKVIEDACQAHGAEYKGKRVGSFGDAAAFSFYPAKNLGAYGDGGMVVTEHQEVAEKISTLRHYGQRAKYEHIVKGGNWRLDTLQAAVLSLKLKHLEEWNHARRKSAAYYGQLLQDADVITPLEAPYAKHIYHLYVIRLKNRDQAREHLAERGIETGIHYPIPIHLTPAYQDLGYKRGDFPISERLADEILSLPLHPFLKEEEIEFVAENIKAVGKR